MRRKKKEGRTSPDTQGQADHLPLIFGVQTSANRNFIAGLGETPTFVGNIAIPAGAVGCNIGWAYGPPLAGSSWTPGLEVDLANTTNAIVAAFLITSGVGELTLTGVGTDGVLRPGQASSFRGTNMEAVISARLLETATGVEEPVPIANVTDTGGDIPITPRGNLQYTLDESGARLRAAHTFEVSE